MSSSGGWELILKGKWTPYEEEEAKLLEDAMKGGKHTVEYSMRHHNYVVDLDAMQQLNPATGRTRAIRCKTMGGVGGDSEEEDEVLPEATAEDVKAAEKEKAAEPPDAADEDGEAATAAVATAPPAKKARKAYRCPVSADEFLKNAKRKLFTFAADPKIFKGDSQGWHAYSVVRQKFCGKPIIIQLTCIMRVLASSATGSKTFMKDAETKWMKLHAMPCEFNPGSFGWHMYKKGKLLKSGKMVAAIIQMNAVVRGSKPLPGTVAAAAAAPAAPPAAAAADTSTEVKADRAEPAAEATAADAPSEAKIDREAVKEVIAEVGAAAEGEKDDLKKISGIGPTTERRLNQVGITTFKQMAKLTTTTQGTVMKAIEYFPGEAPSSDMMQDAKILAEGRVPVRSRTFADEETQLLALTDG